MQRPLWNHPGKKLITITGKRVRPMLRLVVNAEVDGNDLAAALAHRLKETAEAAARSFAGEVLEYRDYGLQLECTEEEMLSVEERHLQQREGRIVVGAESPDLPWVPESDAIDHHPDDGNLGVWLVSGLRHSCLVCGVSTAREAWSKALESGGVGEWEICSIKFVGADLPEVIRL